VSAIEQLLVGIYDRVQRLAQQLDTIDSDLVERLIRSDEIVLIGITHRLLPAALFQAIKVRRAFWRKIQVVYPNRTNLQQLIDERQIPSECLNEWEASKIRIQNFYLRHAGQLLPHWECLESVQDLSFIGSRYKYNEQAYIQFTPLLLGSDPHDTKQIIISNNISLFDQISRAIDAVVLHSAKILHSGLPEWDLLGQYDQGIFRYLGILNRAQVANPPELEGLAFPVVLIVLYVRTFLGTRLVLQERTIYNSMNDTGTYSNISGRLCTDDVVSLHPGHFWVDFTTSNIVATNAFNDFSNLREGDVLDEIVWRRAAVRELQEELGLDIDYDRLEKRFTCYLEREKRGNLFFQIFSLQLSQELHNDELALIEQRRPDASLNQYRIKDLWHVYNERKFNSLLQAHFTDLFLPLFQQIHIAT
jgi:8-oxo-dGTP pyrophosphatase MutT (NUDIX family)